MTLPGGFVSACEVPPLISKTTTDVETKGSQLSVYCCVQVPGTPPLPGAVSINKLPESLRMRRNRWLVESYATGPRNGLIQRVCGLRSSRWVYHTFLNPRHIILSRPHYHSLYGLPSDDLAEDELCTSTTPLAPLASLGSSPIVIFQSRFPVIGSSGINRM